MSDTFDILHLSDTHLFAGDGRHYGTVDTRANLERVLARASAIERLDLVACTGDLSDDGTPESYRTLRDLVEPWAAARGARVAYAMGNHDLHDGFREVLGETTPVFSVAQTRVVVLDTAVPGAGYGRLGAEQLDLLAQQLATPSPRGTVVLLHHPPIPAATPLLAALELQDPEAFVEVIRGTDVRVVLAGHYHLSLVDAVAGIPVVVSGGVANQSDLFAPAGHEGAVRGAAGTIVRLDADGGVRVLPFTAAAPDDGGIVFALDADEVARIAAEAGPPAA
ncbi:calcineurin-like phosphoesterase family protein [Frondihabitans sp. PhB188]|uniref:metallophosphoesterase n=1 Tax=Frondihabitans sp. PhB188 TaxID=2485200 RepID=UPI000F4AC8FF|nr:metallophosphoesterase [Frondihabitans sp. PhB188]ROQ39732.1 calcineurin-like phosphoesterase family protein [Frondihabitans sp. PhB188]